MTRMHSRIWTYTRDLATVFSRGAVLMGPQLKGQWWDQQMMGRAFERLGVPILGAIEPPGYLEGGGVTLIGDDTAVVSLCDRANETGTRALRELVLGKARCRFPSDTFTSTVSSWFWTTICASS